MTQESLQLQPVYTHVKEKNIILNDEIQIDLEVHINVILEIRNCTHHVLDCKNKKLNNKFDIFLLYLLYSLGARVGPPGIGAGVGMLKIPLITPGAAVGILLGSVMLHFGAKQQGSLGSDTSLHSAGRLSYLGHL